MNWITKFIKPKIKSLFEKKSSKSASLAQYLAIVEAKSSVVPVPSLGIIESHPKLERQTRAEGKTLGLDSG